MSLFVDSLSEKQKEDITQKLCNFVYGNALPFSIVEKELFKDLLKALRPSYFNFITSRYQLSGHLLNAQYNSQKIKINDIINSSNNWSIITDGWLNISNERVINFLLVQVDSDYPTPMFLKPIKPKQSSVSGEYMTEKLKQVIEEVGPEKIISVVSDNAAYMKMSHIIINEAFPRYFASDVDLIRWIC